MNVRQRGPRQISRAMDEDRVEVVRGATAGCKRVRMSVVHAIENDSDRLVNSNILEQLVVYVRK